jgi:hypothetical protein
LYLRPEEYDPTISEVGVGILKHPANKIGKNASAVSIFSLVIIKGSFVGNAIRFAVLLGKYVVGNV